MPAETNLAPHPNADNPTEVWEQMKSSQRCHAVSPLPLDTPVKPTHIRFVYMSDTHENLDFDFEIPNGDVFLFGGDMSKRGKVDAIKKFNEFLGTLPHRYKLVIVGNHELTMDPKAFSTRKESSDMDYNEKLQTKWGIDVADTQLKLSEMGIENPKDILSTSRHCTLLHDSSAEVYGLKIYGSPWSPEFCNMAFNLKRGKECFDKWQEIPSDTDVLMTHAPPLGHGDFVPRSGKRQGCVDLLNVVQNRVKPRVHVFGHMHEGHGITTDGNITFINGSTMNEHKQPVNPPIIFDLPLPPGVRKDEHTVNCHQQ